jgi:amino acid transporter
MLPAESHGPDLSGIGMKRRRSRGEDAAQGAASPYAAEAGTLGVFLCWAIVFADIGTSVYYTPGILFGKVGTHTGLFVDLVFLVFVLLSLQYAEVAVRFPEGGGVVSVATKAIHPFAGLVGGLFILADYFLTAGISATSGVIYLSVVLPALAPWVLVGSVAAIVILGILNVVGISSSAEVTLFFAIAALIGQLAVVVAVLVALGPARVIADFGRMFSGPPLTTYGVLTGYAGAFLAFSGLESIAQLAPAMKSPRHRLAPRAMLWVVVTMLLTTPLLSLWTTTLLAPGANLNQGISLLGGLAAGPVLQTAVAVSGALLLIFACNTAMIGAYHVFLALSRMRLFPAALQRTNTLRRTPHVAIGFAVLAPVTVVLFAKASPSLLGDLYAFGLLGAFSVTCVGLTLLRWQERHDRRSGRRAAKWRGPIFGLGFVTTAAVVLAWVTNLFAKPYATLYGGVFVLGGLAVAFVTLRLQARQGRYAIFPYLHWPGHPTVLAGPAPRLAPASILAFLPSDPAKVADVVDRALAQAGRGPAVFVFRGSARRTRPPSLLEILDPYDDDPAAQAAFQSAEWRARKAGIRVRYVYIPAGADEGLEDAMRRQLRPDRILRE